MDWFCAAQRPAGTCRVAQGSAGSASVTLPVPSGTRRRSSGYIRFLGVKGALEMRNECIKSGEETAHCSSDQRCFATRDFVVAWLVADHVYVQLSQIHQSRQEHARHARLHRGVDGRLERYMTRQKICARNLDLEITALDDNVRLPNFIGEVLAMRQRAAEGPKFFGSTTCFPIIGE
jgi:hypothetical protein